MLLLFVSLLSTDICLLHLSSTSLCSLGQQLFLPASHEILPNSIPTPLHWAFVSSGTVQEILGRGRDPVLAHVPDYQIRMIFLPTCLRWKPPAAHGGYSLIWLPLTAQRQVSSHVHLQNKVSKFKTGLQVSLVSTPVFATDFNETSKELRSYKFHSTFHWVSP